MKHLSPEAAFLRGLATALPTLQVVEAGTTRQVDIAEATSVAMPEVSKHLRWLTQAGMVEAHRVNPGTRGSSYNHYAVTDKGRAWLAVLSMV